MFKLSYTGRHVVWELGASSRPTAGTKGGLTRHTKRAIWAMSGRNPLLGHLMPRASFWRRCKQMQELCYFGHFILNSTEQMTMAMIQLQWY